MYYSSQHVVNEKPLLPSEEKTTKKLELGLKKLYNNAANGNNKRISIRMEEDKEDESVQPQQQLKSTVEHQRSTSELNAISIMLDQNIKKTLWGAPVENPMRLDITTTTIEEESEEEEEEEEEVEEEEEEEEEVEEEEEEEVEEEEEEEEEQEQEQVTSPFSDQAQLPFQFKKLFAEAEQEQVTSPFSDQVQLPFQFKKNFAEAEQELLSTLHVAIEEKRDSVEFELPFAATEESTTLDLPPKKATTPNTLPLKLLPVKKDQLHYYDEEAAPYSAVPYSTAAPLSAAPMSAAPLSAFPHSHYSWLQQEEDQQTIMSISSRRMSTAFNSLYNSQDFSVTGFTEKTWEAIFHPLSTFKHNKGKLEYYAWNPTNLPLAAAKVAQRVIHATAYSGANDKNEFPMHNEEPVEQEATLPILQPTPPLKPSPVLTIIASELEKGESQLTLVEPILTASVEKQQDYYDMLQKIRGDEEEFESIISSGDSLASSVVEEKENEETAAKISRVGSCLSLPALLTRKSAPAPALEKQHSTYTIEDDEELHTAVAMMNAEPEEIPRYLTEKRLFFAGFVCPLVWFYAAVILRGVKNPNDARWQKRCRLASLYFTVSVSVITLVILVKQAGSAASRQTASDTIRAVINQ